MNNTYYLVRHGESKFNLERRHQGWTSGNPLTQTGIFQAERLAGLLKSQAVDAIFSSPLLRTKQTARIFSKTVNKPVSYSNNLLDFRRSKSQEGLSVAEYSALTEFQSWKENVINNPDFSLPDGESRNMFSSRIIDFASRNDSKFSHKKILVVTHVDVIWQLVLYWTNKDIDKMDIKNCVVFKIQPDSNSLEKIGY